jgi:hypothetical protein
MKHILHVNSLLYQVGNPGLGIYFISKFKIVLSLGNFLSLIGFRMEEDAYYVG